MKSIPLYQQIKEYIKKQIDSGELNPGDQIPIEADLMEQFHVSRATTKTALKYLVDAGLLYRIAGKGTFVTSEEIRQSSHNELNESFTPKKIGFIMPPIEDLLCMKLLRGVDDTCKDEGCMLMIRSVLTQSEERLAIHQLILAGVDGLIIFPADGEAYSDEILKLKTSGFPFVLVDRYLPGIKTNAVYSDNYQGGILGTEYLIGIGHTSIGVVSLTKSTTASAEDRFRGYLDTVRKNKLQIEINHWLTRIDELSYKDEENTKEYIREWLADQTELTAIFTLSPQAAVMAARIILSMGKRIPEDIAILTFDDPKIDDLSGSYFSFMEQDIELMGIKAVQLLLKTILVPSTLEQIVIPVTIHIGRSS
ncbi:GntR family transcriptional regulator [Paenibacillus psychroresistens]|uniref:GntR family transcriptional regulator n=1 Tax=Paenibacillus psychroresistens TaxID=1778678 RepID=A0A6B8RU76_9BACL|nr:GntR family transcriptional regulator [Paenibacillus psychroresistens]QGQ99399.1 GntR family transcriptional regulator [Paenibacillus psychroresistens]